jgi:hypothetical protein
MTILRLSALAVELEPHFAREAKQRQGTRTDLEPGGNSATKFGKSRDAAGKPLVATVPQAVKGKSRDAAGKAVGRWRPASPGQDRARELVRGRLRARVGWG